MRADLKQPTLFPATTTPKCSRGCTHKHLCVHDADLEHGNPVGKRPHTCLNTAQNRDGIPY